MCIEASWHPGTVGWLWGATLCCGFWESPVCPRSDGTEAFRAPSCRPVVPFHLPGRGLVSLPVLLLPLRPGAQGRIVLSQRREPARGSLKRGSCGRDDGWAAHLCSVCPRSKRRAHGRKRGSGILHFGPRRGHCVPTAPSTSPPPSMRVQGPVLGPDLRLGRWLIPVANSPAPSVRLPMRFA